MGARADLPRWLAAVIAVQLLTAAGAVAGPWAVVPAGQAAPVAVGAAAAAPPAAERAADEPAGVTRGGSVAVARALPVVSAEELWPGQVSAVPLGVDAAGQLEVPSTEAEIGWWADGPRPGEAGAAILVGHVDLDGRAGVFAKLAQARIGAIVVVDSGRDEAPVRFRVTRVDRYAKAQFPTDVVYRPADGPELRLITCGGRFDPRSGHYEDNVVVQAVRV